MPSELRFVINRLMPPGSGVAVPVARSHLRCDHSSNSLERALALFLKRVSDDPSIANELTDALGSGQELGACIGLIRLHTDPVDFECLTVVKESGNRSAHDRDADDFSIFLNSDRKLVRDHRLIVSVIFRHELIGLP